MWDERLKLAAYCPACGSSSSRMEVRPLGAAGDAQLLHATCRRCACKTLVLTVAGPSAAGAVGLATDLTAEEIAPSAGRQAVSADDVLAAHALAGRPPASWLPMPKEQPPAARRTARRAPAAQKRVKAAKRRGPAA